MTEEQVNALHDGLPRVVFFDAGNTLLHVHPTIGQVYADVSRDFGCSVSPEKLEKGLLEVWGEYLEERRGKTGEDLQTSEEHEYEMWRTLTYGLHERVPALTCERGPWFGALHRTFGEARRFRMFPDVAETLRKLREMKIRVGIISNWDRRLESILEGVGLREHLDLIVISSLVGYSKPHPRIFEIALEKAGIRPDEAVHVGDTFRDDVEGARSVGIEPVLVKRSESLGISAKYLLSERPAPDCPYVTSLSDLPSLLSR